MQIPLDQFEQIIDEKILQRGLAYFQDGQVREIEEVSPGVYETVVEGSEDYNVQLTIENNVVTKYRCNCPYDMGPVCKHVTAVIFALQKENLEMTIPKPKKKTSSKTSKKKSITTQINDMLNKASKEELVQLIQKEAKRNAVFQNNILIALEHYNENMSQSYYELQIDTILNALRGRYGYLDFHSSIAAGLAVSQMLDTAHDYVEKQNYQIALYICFAVLEKMGVALNHADDSNGNIGGCVAVAYEMLCDIAGVCEEQTIRRQIFDYSVHVYENNVLAGWDWHLDLLRLAAELVNSDEDFNRIIALAEKSHRSEYDDEECQAIKYRLLRKRKDDAVAEAFLQENIQNYRFRRMAIEKALESKNYDMAIKLAKDGVKQDMKNKPGLAKEWYDWLLKTAQAQNDVPKIIEYARYLLIDNFRNEQDYYQILKQHVKQEEWNAFVENIIQDIKSQKRWIDYDLIATIYIQEMWWGRLWEMVKHDGNLSTIERYESYLTKDYSKDLAELYAERILQYMVNNVGRSHYMNACRYIRRIIKLGEQSIADEVVTALKAQYRNRPALIQELNKV